MADQRTATEKKLWDSIGPPLYYCADCLRAVQVTPIDGAEPVVVRPCDADCGVQIIAPRKSLLAGEGGLNFADKVKMSWWQVLAALTGRCA